MLLHILQDLIEDLIKNCFLILSDACPAPSPLLSSCAIIDACYTDDMCPGSQHCCVVAPDCGKQCVEPEEGKLWA